MKQPFLITSHGVLYDADCLQVLGCMKPGVVDTVFADPPFNIGKDYRNGYDDAAAQTEYASSAESVGEFRLGEAAPVPRFHGIGVSNRRRALRRWVREPGPP